MKMIGDLMTVPFGIVLVSVLVSIILIVGTEMVLKHIREEK